MYCFIVWTFIAAFNFTGIHGGPGENAAYNDDDKDTAANLALAQWKRQYYFEKLGFDIWTDDHQDTPSSLAEVS